MHIVDTDVLVIGAGQAGCLAALRARELVDNVVILEKARTAKSGASTFTNQMLAATPSGEAEKWKQELVEAGDYINDQDWVDVLLEEEGQRVQNLIDWGVPFERNDDGQIRTAIGRGHRSTRMMLVNGHKLMAILRQRMLDLGVEVRERMTAVELLTSDGEYPTAGRVTGALAMDSRTGELVLFRARAVVIATGQMGVKMRCHFINNLTGDGPAMAYRVGAQLTGMEFCIRGNVSYYEHRYHSGSQSLLQGMGARFVNSLGETFMEKYDPIRKDRAKLSIICQAFAKEHLEGRGPLYFDMRAFTAEDVATIRRLLPTTLRPFDEGGLDIRQQPLEVSPVMNIASSSGDGGIYLQSISCDTNIPGLYATGAATKNPVHGTYSVGSINLAYNNVSGYRAGEYAARFAREIGEPAINQAQLDWVEQEALRPLRAKPGITPDQIIHQLQQITVPVGRSIFKSAESINQVITELRQLEAELDQIYAVDPHQLVKAHEARNVLLTARLIYRAAQERQESRGWHYRPEYPYLDNQDWLRWVIMQNVGQEEAKVWTWELPWDKYTVQPPARTKVAHPVQLDTQVLERIS